MKRMSLLLFLILVFTNCHKNTVEDDAKNIPCDQIITIDEEVFKSIKIRTADSKTFNIEHIPEDAIFEILHYEFDNEIELNNFNKPIDVAFGKAIEFSILLHEDISPTSYKILPNERNLEYSKRDRIGSPKSIYLGYRKVKIYFSPWYHATNHKNGEVILLLKFLKGNCPFEKIININVSLK